MIFYRFGEIPINEKSCIWKGEEKVGEELGVSVYENDIVKAIDWEETTCNVEYKDYGFCLCNKRFRDGVLPLFIAADNCDIYVVGNKFDKE